MTERPPQPWWLLGVAVAALGLAAAPGVAQPAPGSELGKPAAESGAPGRPSTPAAESGAPAEPGTPTVSLDRLLKLPDSLDYSLPSRGGATRPEWRARFVDVREKLAGEREALEVARTELEKVAGSTDAWQVGPPIPGVQGGGDAPLDYQLREKIRRHREGVESLERDLRELEVEANLANVPEDWRE